VQLRFVRAVTAIALCTTLLSMMLSERNNLIALESRLRFSITTSSYKISELIYEATQFLSAVRAYRVGEKEFPRVQLQFEVLWSRVDVLLAKDLSAQPQVYGATLPFLGLLKAYDPIIIGKSNPPRSELIQMHRDLEPLIINLRHAWISEFNDQTLSGGSVENIDIISQRRSYELSMIALLSAICVYLLAEIYFATVAQRRERQMRDTAQAASLTKSHFIANVSHEVRTPLNGILGMTRILEETNLDNEQREHLRVLSDAGGMLLSTINDVLDFSKIEAGRMQIRPTTFSLDHAINTTLKLYENQARAKSLNLTAECPEDLNLWGDGRRLRQVLNNLVSNAIKFTTQGHVAIKVVFSDEDGLRISVTDTGPGISEFDYARVFEPFGQVDGSTRREQGGTGLGLAISRDLCRAMGGDLELESTVGCGARFDVTLPLKRSHQSVAKPTESTQETSHLLKQLRVLIVDDNKTNRLILSKFVGAVGIEADEAASGVEALERIGSQNYHMVFMDIQMPGMDGIEATQHILQSYADATAAGPCIVGVTANALEHQVQSYIDAGMTTVLPKPVSKVALIETLKSCAIRRMIYGADRDVA
jgi:signal transduction histidine kinase/ActR/RegA family two-component response regulator